MKRSKDSDLVVLSSLGSGDAVEWVKLGETVVGNFVSFEKGIGKYESNLYHFQNDKGDTFSVWGNANLDPILSYAKKGERIRIRFKGLVKTKKNRKVRTFEVAGPPALAKRLKAPF